MKETGRRNLENYVFPCSSICDDCMRAFSFPVCRILCDPLHCERFFWPENAAPSSFFLRPSTQNKYRRSSPPNRFPPRPITVSPWKHAHEVFPPWGRPIFRKRKNGGRGFTRGGGWFTAGRYPPPRRGGAVLFLSRFGGVAKL